jgi:hypothetical protein
MSTKDVTRRLFQPHKHYAAVRLQQGRSLLDSDYNEGADLDGDEWRRAVLDIVGPRGTPDEGFSIGQSVLPGDDPTTQTAPLRVFDHILGFQAGEQFLIGGQLTFAVPVSVRAGTFYLGGMRLELDRPEPIMFQRDFLQIGPADLQQPTPTLYYLDAWEQPVTAVEDEELQDRALGGPDTMVRVRRFRQVKLLALQNGVTTCREGFNQLIDRLEQDGSTFDCNTSELESPGRLQLVFQTGSESGPCTPDPPAQYLGTENQTLRVMLTDPNNFVWAFDNAAPLYRVNLVNLMSDPGGANPGTLQIQLLTPPKDVEHQPVKNRVIEFLPFAALLDGTTPLPPDRPHFRKAAAEMGVFTAVSTGLGDDGVTFTVDVSGDVLGELQALITSWSSDHPFFDFLDPDATNNNNPTRPMYARFWHLASDGNVKVPINTSSNGAPLADTGIIPVFHQQGRAGDFWVAALRPDAPQEIVPFDILSNTAGVAPHGPRHFFAPLFVLGWDGVDNVVTSVDDCRSRMRRLVDAGCTTFTVGDGLHTVGDFTVIQDAIDALPPDGGRVSILPGLYQQKFVISGRTNVTVEGCGDETIIQTPPNQSAGQLALITEASDNITIANLRFNAVEQPAIVGAKSSNLALVGLSAFAFVPSGNGVAPGGATSDAGLIELHDSSHALLQGLLLEPARRPAIFVQGTIPTTTTTTQASDVTITDVTAKGTGDATQAPTPAAAALIEVQGMHSVVIRKASLSTFGQVAVGLIPPAASPNAPGNVDIRLSELTILASSHPSLEVQPAVDVDGGDHVLLEDSDITMDVLSEEAAVIVQGTAVVVRGNTVNGIVPAPGVGIPSWAGIQVRGGSSKVEIRDNDIAGGLGHGITIGSVLWGTDKHREATGTGQITTSTENQPRFVTGDLAGGIDDGTTAASDEGAVTDLTIADNRISEFLTNGISALTVLGMPVSGSTTDLLQVANLRIERNTIENNLTLPFDGIRVRSDFLPFPAAAPTIVGLANPIDLRVLPYGGIVLGCVTGSLLIAGNSIEGNGTTPVEPVNGIFILSGDGIEVVQNKIARNGSVAVPNAGNTDETPKPGVRAGIAVMLAGTEDGDTTAIQELLKIDPTVMPDTVNSKTVALRVYQNSVQQPEGRALHAVAIGALTVDGNFLSSQGFHGAATKNDAFAVGDVVFLQDLGAPVEVTDADTIFLSEGAGSPFPGFATPPGATAMLVNNPTGSPRRFVGAGGGVLFANNQVIYDWDVKRPIVTVAGVTAPVPLSYFAVTILSLDHATCVGNHFALRLGGVAQGSTPPPLDGITEPLVSNVFAAACTVQMARNRFAENVLATTLSAVSGCELMNVTSGNIGTHPMFAYVFWGGEDSRFFFQSNNVALFTKNATNFDNLRSSLRTQLRNFIQLLQQPTP